MQGTSYPIFKPNPLTTRASVLSSVLYLLDISRNYPYINVFLPNDFYFIFSSVNDLARWKKQFVANVNCIGKLFFLSLFLIYRCCFFHRHCVSLI